MTVLITIAKTIAGVGVSDSLAGGSTGYDLGSSKSNTTQVPVNAWYLTHDGATYIENLSYYISLYTGTYGGAYSASADKAKILAHGDAGYGFEVEEDYSADSLTPYFGSPYRIATGLADAYVNRRLVQASSMLYNNSSVETAPSAAEAGKIGELGNTVLGDVCKLRKRYIVPTSETLGGKRQIDFVYTYNFST